MKWSVLDQSPSSAGSTQGAAIRESIALAQHSDALGYERYSLLAETFGLSGAAAKSP